MQFWATWAVKKNLSSILLEYPTFQGSFLNIFIKNLKNWTFCIFVSALKNEKYVNFALKYTFLELKQAKLLILRYVGMSYVVTKGILSKNRDFIPKI